MGMVDSDPPLLENKQSVDQVTYNLTVSGPGKLQQKDF